MNISVVSAREEHIPEIGRLEEVCFSAPWTRAMLARQLADGSHVLLCALAGELVTGYAGFSYVLDEGYIGNVAVDPDWRGRGIGAALVETMLARARALDLAFLALEVREGNAVARTLYAHRGFEIVGMRKNYYEKPVENAILMTAFLKQRVTEC